jgi:MFS family permease
MQSRLAGRIWLTETCRIVGSILVCASVNIAMLMVGRFVNGLSVGICSAQVPVYITEVSPPSMRGTLVSLQQWAITWGILIMYFICYGCSFINGTASFRVPWGLQIIPAACLFGGLLREPESPRWLLKKDREDEARDVLVLLHGNGNPHDPFVQQELQEIRAAVEEECSNSNASWLELFAPRMLNRTSIGVFTQIWSQLTGMNVMVSPESTLQPSECRALADLLTVQMYYITYVFTMAGMSTGGECHPRCDLLKRNPRKQSES